MQERLGLELARHDAGEIDQRGERHRQRAARDPDGLRPDAHRGRARPGGHRRAAQPLRRHAGGVQDAPCARPPPPVGSAPRRSSARSPSSATPGPTRTVTTSSTVWCSGWTPTARSAPSCAGVRRRRLRRPPSSAGSCAPNWSRTGGTSRPPAGSATSSPRSTSSARRSTWTRRTPGVSRSWPGWRPRCGRWPARSPARCHHRRGGRHAGRRPGPDHPGQGGVPGLDAGAGRQGDRRAARHPLRHPRAGPPDRVLPRPDQRRRRSTTPGRARTSPARAGCGGRCRRASPTSPPGAR